MLAPMRIAMLLHKSVEHDSRVRREARALSAAGHEVTVLHLPRERGRLDGELEGFRVRSVTPPAWVRERLPTVLYRAVFLLAFLRALRRLRPDAVHAHDAAMLLPGWAGARLTGAALVYDSHEYAAGVPYRDRLWALLVSALERALVRRCSAVVTVSDGIADRLRSRYRLAERPVVVRNLPDPAEEDGGAAAEDLRSALGLEASTTLVLHLGAVARDRGCETLTRAMAGLPTAHLLFLGADDSGFAAHLREVAHEAGVADRVHLRPSVPTGQIRAHARQGSVGVTLLEDTCENHRLALPNKLFEYLAAQIPVLAGDLPEMRRTAGGLPGVTLVDPADAVAVAAGLRAALERGPGGPSPFQWTEDAARLTELYAGLGAARREKQRGKGGAVVLVRNGVTHDARVLREARLLGSLGYETTVVGVRTGAGEAAAERLGDVDVVRLEPGAVPRRALGALRRRKGDVGPGSSAGPRTANGSRPDRPSVPSRSAPLRRLATTLDYYRRGLGFVRRARPDLIHANDYNTAWIGVAGKLLTGARLVYDSHELWPDRNLRPEPRGWLLLCESLFVRLADRVVTTSPGYAQVMARRYRIDPPAVVRNVPEWRAGDPPGPGSAVGAEAEAGADGGAGGPPPLAVYFGALTRNRGLPAALRALALVPELRMRLVGPEAWGYRRTLAELAEELGIADRVEILDPVPPDEATAVLADADVGLALIEPACLSYRMTLPNKLYEYVAAGLPVLASDIPVLAGEVRAHGLGRVADPADPAAVAATLREMLDPDTQRELRASVARHAAVAIWGRERERLAEVYASLAQS
jgi:glycosyltransferase involved in cell wall biosynthesis